MAYLDIGYIIIIIDIILAKSLNLEFKAIDPVPIIGIGLRHLLTIYIIFDTYFRSRDNVAYIPIEAYLVENLKAKLLISIDVIGYKGFRLDLDARIVRITSYIGLSFPISTYTKPYHAAERAVYVDYYIIILANSITRVRI